jgi:hypothetical protein
MTGPGMVDPDHYHLTVHGGLGDFIWVYKKLCNLDAPLYVSVVSENRTRPRRSGPMLDHMPRVIGWQYVDSTFASGGNDWTKSADDPACAIGKTWAELKVRKAVPFKIECNRWLEAGNRLEGWLPDLPTTHRVPFEDPGPPTTPLTKPAVVVHLAGWPDVEDQTWVNCIHMLSTVASVYVVGGSYDRRPRIVHTKSGGPANSTLVEDVPFADLYALWTGTEYCIGHASGFTIGADAVGAKGVVYNPRNVPHLIGTWEDPDNRDMIHVDRVIDFEKACYAVYCSMRKAPSATWPPSVGRGAKIAVDQTSNLGPDAAAVYAAASSISPRSALFVFDVDPDDTYLMSACVDASYDHEASLTLIVSPKIDTQSLTNAYTATYRSTRRPVIDLPNDRPTITNRSTTFSLAVLVTGPDRRQTYDTITWAWRMLGSRGLLMVTGPWAEVCLSALAESLKVKPDKVDGAEKWTYLYKRA